MHLPNSESLVSFINHMGQKIDRCHSSIGILLYIMNTQKVFSANFDISWCIDGGNASMPKAAAVTAVEGVALFQSDQGEKEAYPGTYIVEDV